MFQLWTFGVIVNLFLFCSIFDIHFKSPIVPVSRRHHVETKAPFKRVVFFSADGLRAETFFQYPERRKYLKNVMERDACVWGISDTSVPTESRPGHVALFAGFNEDPSAVFTGWQENVVEFDTIFNQSSSSIGLGSRDIVPMFAKGDAQSKMFAATYPHEWQDFVSTNVSNLDSWVFDYFVDLAEKRKLPAEDKSVIFLHLLATDTIGHSAKPKSEAYIGSMEYVDGIVNKTEKIVKEYYGDESTLYIFTADHGMTNWGSHGDGSDHETETPFVIWGAGLKKPSVLPVRLNQSDFAALMAGALGINFPSNSIGRFPSSFWDNQEFAVAAVKANLLQIYDLMLTKKDSIQTNRNFPIIPFAYESLIQEQISTNSSSPDQILLVQDTISLALDGIVYYERYDHQLLSVFAVFTNILWILFISYIVIHITTSPAKIFAFKTFSTRCAVVSLLVAPLITKGLIGWSFWRIPYGFFPVYMILLCTKLVGLQASRGSSINSLFLLLVFAALGVEILVNSFDNRAFLSIGLLLNGLWCIQPKKLCSWQKAFFFLTVCSLAIFPTMPVIGANRNPLFMTLGPIFSFAIVAVLFLIRFRGAGQVVRRDCYIVGGQLVLLSLISVLCHFPTLLFTRVVAWISLVQSFFLPIFTSPETVTGRLISVFLAIASPFSLISFSYESLFLPCLFLVLMILLKVEMSGENLEDSWVDFLNLSTWDRERRKLWETVDLHQAVRRAWLHLFFVVLSFFGTGNIASVNSFDPSSTRCFVSVFNPWIMMIILVEKILGPFLLVSCFFRRLLWSNVQIQRSFLIVLLLCQGMGLHTFFMIKNKGSWLEIGMSISHHVIVSATTLCLFLLHFIADFIMTFELGWFSNANLQRFPTSQKNSKIF